ncbi:hypothetical protein L3Y34_003508 [Caenorhabditis briggsae]|uniref:F-box domain-containing protein n=1 Tax=Caenorhabditis briggsae TaxID=6238 RepID=A0AAE9A973_CAEBR|nr:hypothetical protein L3Y34_003508 [Caenorhabditis briggsae]
MPIALSKLPWDLQGLILKEMKSYHDIFMISLCSQKVKSVIRSVNWNEPALEYLLLGTKFQVKIGEKHDLQNLIICNQVKKFNRSSKQKLFIGDVKLRCGIFGYSNEELLECFDAREIERINDGRKALFVVTFYELLREAMAASMNDFRSSWFTFTGFQRSIIFMVAPLGSLIAIWPTWFFIMIVVSIISRGLERCDTLQAQISNISAPPNKKAFRRNIELQ